MADETKDSISLAEVDGIVAATGREPEAAIPILQAIQAKCNYLPERALRRVCETTRITPATMAGVSTFYAQFRHKPAGRHFIKVCIGTACHVKGADDVFAAFKRHLEIGENDDTDRDGLFTVEKVACLGCCMLAPAVQIDKVTYGFVKPPEAGKVLKDFLKSCTETQSAGDEAGADGRVLSGEIRMCLCASCRAGGSLAVLDKFREQIRDLSIPVRTKMVGCTGISYQTPLVEVTVANGPSFRYGRVKPDHVREIVTTHFRPAGTARRVGVAVSRMLEKLLTDEAWEPVTRYVVDLSSGEDAQYFGRQTHLATEHCGEMGPLDIDDYLRRGGFETLRRCLMEMSPEEIIDRIDESGLRGRGGAGFPTGRKWRSVRAAAGDVKYVICNGDEGDPGAFMNRIVLESYPFRVIEGIAIAARAVGAADAIMYVRAEYPLALEHVRKAIRICLGRGIVGEDAMGSGRPMRIRVVEGAGAFVCGEETALMAAVEGRRGTPRLRPPYPSESGLWGKPTLVNNVETLAHVPWILRNGPPAFRAFGTSKSPGTKTFALAGKILRGGMVEVSMGVTLREIVEEIGGGIDGGRRFKAVQIGGPSGGCIPSSLADTPVDYESLVSAGAMMGSGGLVVLDDSDCMVDMARYFMTFTQRESCGKCTHCRIGTRRMLDILNRLCAGNGRPGDVEKLEHLGREVKKGSLCQLGGSAPNPVLTTIRYFREEYDAHVLGRCQARKCAALIKYVVTDKCIGCTKCSQNCPVEAIPFTPYEKHAIDVEKCTRCDTCRKICPAEAIEVTDKNA